MLNKKRSLVRLLVLVTICGGAFILIGGAIASFFFYSVFIIVLYATGVFLLKKSNTKVQRTLSHQRVTVGDSLRISISIHQKRYIPFYWTMIRDCNDIHHLSSIGTTCFILSANQTQLCTYGLYHLRRGVYHFSGIEVTQGDRFGLIQRSFQVPLHDEIWVYPKIYPLQYEWQGVGQETTLQMIHKRSPRGITTGIRDYQSGDRLQMIHWKTSARGLGLKVRLDEEATSSHSCMILFDLRSKKADFEIVVSFVASLAHYFFERARSFSVVFVGESIDSLLVRTKGHVQQLMERLTQIQPVDSTDIKFQSLSSYVVQARHLCVVSANLNQEMNQFVQGIQTKTTIDLFLLHEPASKQLTGSVPIWNIQQDEHGFALRGVIRG
ncbi:DUF58 domain-containing protein [Hazenella sp. IB182357]|uniref:DUF58 domain-containing protein n=1 Tax=Polycladospora coralii TaxID=2771432 RepID=A0A926N602_9BACL|nr:DUF58 domain-containing protein [Polycladospora coralii]MBD1372274.1 DUF58 domain-containing protein [Polycladospora coralii]MBS7531536.1 DUF58 domain-containing protein [Polycladospora coralii]